MANVAGRGDRELRNTQAKCDLGGGPGSGKRMPRVGTIGRLLDILPPSVIMPRQNGQSTGKRAKKDPTLIGISCGGEKMLISA